MKPSSVLFVFLQLCCFQMMLLSRPVCKLPGLVVQNAHNHLRDLVGPTVLTQPPLPVCASVHELLPVLQGGDFPAQCQRYNNIIIFPDSALTEVPANHHQVNLSFHLSTNHSAQNIA